jgi:predicted ferric reductase
MTMNRIWIAFATCSAVIAGVFVASVAGSLDVSDSHALGVAFTQFTGILSIAMMAFATLLSVRPRWLEPALGGLDKMYRLHKWLGIGGIGLGILHWLTATGDGHHPMADAAAGSAQQTTDAAQTLLQSLTGPAHGVGQPALFLLIALGLVALVKAIPYRWFAKTHILTALAFFALAFHSIVLVKAGYWTTPVAWLTAPIIAIGVVTSLWSIVRYFGGLKRTKATVIDQTYFPELRVLEAELRMAEGWNGHQPGQFAFVTTNWSEGAHPFTIATHWDAKDRRIGFIAKELGDDTKRLRENFAVGSTVDVEGPYGRFTFESGKPRQIWIGGGIGITPFVAKMRELAGRNAGLPIDLFHSTTDVSEAALAKMRADAEAAGVTLHIIISPRDGRLDAAKIKAAVPDWARASVWFCGPTGLGAALRRDLVAGGLPSSDFHQELFEMR